MPVVIEPNIILNNEGNLQQYLAFSNPGYFFSYITGSPLDDFFPVDLVWPAFNLMTQYAGYTNWKIEMNVEQGSSPSIWMTVNLRAQISDPFPAVQDDGAGPYYFKHNLLHSTIALYNLAEGVYNNDIRVKVTATDTTGARVTIAEKVYPVVAFITNTFEPLVRVLYHDGIDGSLCFSYEYGSNTMQPQYVYVAHNIDFDVILTDPSGMLHYVVEQVTDYYSKITISFVVPVTQPAPGVLHSSITIVPDNSDVGNSIVPIQIYVHPVGSGIIPAALQFTAVLGEAETTPQLLSIFLGYWSIESLPSWLNFNVTSGYYDTVIVKAVNYSTMDPGIYNFNLVFVTGEGNITVPVQLTVAPYLVMPFSNTGLFFTKELDYLKFTSPVAGTYVSILLNIKIFSLERYHPQTYTREYKLPLFSGLGDFHVGSVVHQLFDEIENLRQVINEFEYNFIRTQYRPAEIDLYYTELAFSDNAVLRTGSFTGIKMIKGLRPDITATNTGILNTMGQELSRITRNSVINMNFAHFNVPEIYVKKNGVVIDSFNYIATGSVLYSYFRFNEDLKIGDVLEIMLKKDYSRTRRFLVLPEGKESTHVFFENQNGMIEAFEFTGRRRLSSEYSHTTNATFKNLYEYDRKISAKNNQSVIINTGFILPADHKVVDAIIKSENVWCAFDTPAGPYYRIDAKTSKLANIDTNVKEIDFDVEFTILDNADVTIYIQ